MDKAEIGIIGGSGLYDMEGFESIKEIEMDTPFGKPSDKIILGTISGVKTAFLPRHGRKHKVNPTNVPYLANVFALKTLGVSRIIAVNACGSLKEEILPGDIVIPDQIIDRTKCRPNTFFDPIAVHVSFADPFCPALNKIIAETIETLGLRYHIGGIYVCMEGPLFSTRAESNMHRSWGASLIGMTALPEAKLAREAEICYSSISCSTDYDVWKDELVDVDMVIKRFHENISNVKKIIGQVVPKLNIERTGCDCKDALRHAILSDKSAISEQMKKDLRPLLEKYV